MSSFILLCWGFYGYVLAFCDIASAEFSYPMTLAAGTRREQDGCSWPDSEFDLNQDRGNMSNPIIISSSPSSASALIDSHIGNVPQPGWGSAGLVNSGVTLILSLKIPPQNRLEVVALAIQRTRSRNGL